MNEIIKKLMENRLSESKIKIVSLDPEKLEKAMKDYGYEYDEELVLEFLADKYGLEDGEHYQLGNGELEFLFYTGTQADRCIKELSEAVDADGNESIDQMFHEDLQKYKGKPIKDLFQALSGTAKVDIKLDRPNIYGSSGYGGTCSGVPWCYADMVIKDIAAGTGKYVDVYIKA